MKARLVARGFEIRKENLQRESPTCSKEALRNEEMKIKFAPLADLGQLKLVVYSDAAFGNLRDGGSQKAYLIFLVGPNNKCNILAWQSKRIKRVTRSTLAAEATAARDAVEAVVFLSYIISELYYGEEPTKRIPIQAFTDNHSLYVAVTDKKRYGIKTAN
uniref:uncharacterized protein LOC113475551 n=1 Tax=Ciona intestinalis TaxID=7719 RepID=UPI000EF4515A|nr:uncharacterized protein LOC113475551 [Ciona intestinalis]|eukprot:XP_026695566.1 uncharacterized protein LOC113475551 [Ciona intestinalis]